MSTQWINVYDAEYEDLQVQVENVNVTLTDTITGQIIERTLIAGYDVFTGVKGHRYNIVINKSGYNTIDTYFTWPTISGTSEDYYLQNTIGLTAPEGKTYLNLYVVDDSTGKSLKRMTFSVYDGTSWNSYNTYEAGYATAIVPKNTSVRYVVDSSSMYTGKTGDVTIYENAVTLQVRLTYKPGAPTPTPLPGGITAIPAPTGNLPVPTLTPAQEEENIESTRQMLVQSLPGIASLCILVVFVGLIDMIMPKRRK
jgi:hypothetical protein